MNRIMIKFKFSDRVIETDYGNFKWSTAPMVDLGMHEFKTYYR